MDNSAGVGRQAGGRHAETMSIGLVVIALLSLCLLWAGRWCLAAVPFPHAAASARPGQCVRRRRGGISWGYHT